MSKNKLSPLTPEEYSSQYEYQNKFSYMAIQSQIKFLQGDILTIIEASLIGEQLKAVKSLINQSVNRRLNWLYDLATNVETVDGKKSPGIIIESNSNPPEIVERRIIV